MEDAPTQWTGVTLVKMVKWSMPKLLRLSDCTVMVDFLRGTHWIWKRFRSKSLINRKRIQVKPLGKGILQRPMILRTTLLSLTGKCFKASGQLPRPSQPPTASPVSDIQQVIRRSLRECTHDDRTFIHGACNVIHRWVESVRPAMAGSQTGKGPTQLLADAQKAGQDAVDAILDLMPEVEHKIPPVYPRIDVASVLNISRHHTEEALKKCPHSNLGLDPDTRCGSRAGPGIFQHHPADHLLLPTRDGRDGNKPTVSREPASPQCVECSPGGLGRTISGGAPELLGQLAGFSGGTGYTRSGYLWSGWVSKDSN